MTPKSVLLTVLQPQPLASYLAALGVLRICSLQYDTAVRGAFSEAGFVLEGLDEGQLLKLFLDTWQPTPVVTPWNNASGFYESSKGRLAAAAMDILVRSEVPRFASLVRVVGDVRQLIAAAGYRDAPEKEEKAAFLVRLRSVLPDDAIAWIDAVAVVDEGDARMMPVLGSGGNEGVLDYSSLFLRSLVDVLLGDRARSERLFRSALFGEPTSGLPERPGGQFDPGTAGGFNTGPGFESKDLPNNPWTFMLLMEGAVVWASGIASRQQGAETGYRFAVSPFTVRHRAAGYGSAGRGDDDPQRVRAEVWVPVWRRRASLAEIGRFIAEGRAEVRTPKRETRRAVDSMDFADAVASLGVDRGVDAFVRYAFVKRRGESYIALPAGVVGVHHRRETDLLRQLDGELKILDRFLAGFPSEEGPPSHFVARRRAIDDARFDVAARGGFEAMQRLVRAIGALEMILARRDPGKDPKLPRPLGGLGSEWIEACGDRIEVRLAAALGSIAPTGGAGPFRAYLTALDSDDPRRFAPAMRTVAWAGVDLAGRLANVIHQRLLDVRTRSIDEAARARNPTWGSRRVSLDDVAAFLVPGVIDPRALEELIFGFSWVTHSRSIGSVRGREISPPLPRSYALLKLLFLPNGIPRGDERVNLVPDPAIVPLLRTGRIFDAIQLAQRQLIVRRFQPRQVVDKGPLDAALGRRLAAALLFPTTQIEALKERALLSDDE